jgi:hypothetical protein
MEWYNTKKTYAKRAVAYYRHSAQDRQENSVEIQQDQVRKFAEDNGIEIVEEFIDRGKTGLVTDGRKDFQRMLQKKGVVVRHWTFIAPPSLPAVAPVPAPTVPRGGAAGHPAGGEKKGS